MPSIYFIGGMMADFNERRRFKRFPIYCPLQYKVEDSSPKKNSISLNISEGGTMLSTDRTVEVGSSLIVRMHLARSEFFVRAKVVHIQHPMGWAANNIGVEFLDKASAFILKFYEEVEGVMRYRKLYSEEMGKDVSLTEASMKWYRNSPTWTM